MNPDRILVVEDEAIVAMDIEARLNGLGFALAGRAASGEQALALTAELGPDLVLMDIHLEGEMDGITAADEIRRRHRIPVIFLTAYSEEATLERAKRAEPYGFILKPFDERDLKSTITIALYKHKAESELRRMNRLYNVLSHVNQITIRATDRDTMLHAMCRAMVEHGDIDLAWIGEMNPITRRISVAACFGAQIDLLKTAVFSVGDSPEGQGNPGNAIRHGQHFICNQCGNDTCLYPAEMAPANFGLHSCASFPLRFRGEIWGALNLCVAKEGFFRQKEVALLEEVAGDISFGLDQIENERLRRQEVREKALIAEVLGLINNAADTPALIHSVLASLKKWSGCEAAGIRLRDGDDFPYYETSGFPESFVRLERSLCAYDEQGNVIRDEAGNPALECMCGNIIQGRTDPSLPFFTNGGSFWSNCTTRLLASTTATDRQTRTRNRCNGAGYESVALIPLRSAGKVFGLIQLNDKRQDQFTNDSITLFERLAEHIANFLDKRQIADRLRENQDRLLAITNNLPDSYLYRYCIDQQGQPQFLYLSDGMNRIHRVEAEAVLADARILLDQVDPAQQQPYAQAVKESIEQGTDFAMVLHLHRPDGEWRWVQTRSRPSRRPDGSVVWDGVATDISERYETEERLRKLSAAVEQSPVAVVITDRQGTIDYVNAAAIKSSGYSREELIGQTPRLFKSGETSPEEYRELWQTIAAGGEWRGVFHNRRRDGSLFWERVVIAPLRAADGGITHYVAVKEDITAQKTTEEQLRQSQKLEAIGTLAGGIAHDFNNLLGVILGYAELELGDAAPNSQLWTSLDNIQKAGNRAKDLVRQILTFCRQSETSRQSLAPQPIIKEAVKMLRAAIPTTIEIISDIRDECPPVDADPTQLHQVLMNLCTNAFHAMETRGGRLQIILKPAGLLPPHLTEKAKVKPAGFVELAVSDTGLGIGPDIAERIFDPFFTTKEEGKGTGLGLSIVHSILEEYGGAIAFDTEIGHGTTFHAYFPASAQPSSPEATATVSVPGGEEHILFVDDEETFTEMSRYLLERLGYRVTAECRAVEALATFQEDPDRFDLVIADQNMPVMTGLELATRMLAIRPGLPIILCTGYSSAINEEVALDRGISRFALKPLTKAALASMIRAALDKRT